MDAPLVFTTKGNLPIDSLEYFHAWEDTPVYTKFIEGYKLDGEIIKQSAHVMIKQGQSMAAELEKI
jgi:hypothetical protein